MAVVVRRPPTMTPITMTATVRRGGMEVGEVVGGIVTTMTRTITEIRMTVIIGMVTDTEIVDAGGGDGPAAVVAGAILGAERTRTGAGRHEMTGAIAMATTGGGNGPDRGQGPRTTDEGRIETGTGIVAGRRAMVIRIAEAEEDAVGVRRTDGRIAMKVEGTKSDTAVVNKERQRATRLVGGIAVTMIRREDIATVPVRRPSVTVRQDRAAIEIEIATANVEEVGLGAGRLIKGREIRRKKAKGRRNVEYNKCSCGPGRRC